MNLQWNKTIPCKNIWETQLGGVFVPSGEYTDFYFAEMDTICRCAESNRSEIAVSAVASIPKLSLPYWWHTTKIQDAPVLMIDQMRGIDLINGELMDPPEYLQEEYQKRFRYAHVTDRYKMQDYAILQNGNWGYICTRHGEEIWRFSGRGYLYTDIVKWQNRVFFGTGGQGGYFYMLDIDSGFPIASIKTGGTRHIVQRGNSAYILSNTEKKRHAQLLRINLQDGGIQEAVELPGVASVNSRLQLVDEKLHMITFTYATNRLQNAVWSCVEL